MMIILKVAMIIIMATGFTTGTIVAYKNYCKYAITNDEVPISKMILIGILLGPSLVLLSLLMQPIFSFGLFIIFGFIAHKQAVYELELEKND